MQNDPNNRNDDYYRNVNPHPTHYVNNPPENNYTNYSYKRKVRKKSPAGFLIVAVMISGLVGGGAGWAAARSTMNNQYEALSQQLAQEQEGQESSAVTLSTPESTAETTADTTDNTVSDDAITSVADVAAHAKDSVVEITTEYLSMDPFVGQAISEGGGSGVIFSEDGYIITNNHVVEDANNLRVTTSDGEEYDAALIGTDAKTDLAVIKIEATGLKAATFANSDEIQVGEAAIAIGNPLGQLGGTVTSGIVSAAARDIEIENENMTLIQTSAAVNPGNSGGGLFNADGQLIGIVNAKLAGEEIEGLAFAIPANTVTEIINEIIENGYVTGRPQLGIDVVDVLDQNTASMYRLNAYGVYVATTNQELGLNAADRIVSINGQQIESTADISTILEEYAVGDTINLVVEREGSQLGVDITLREQNNLSGTGGNATDFTQT